MAQRQKALPTMATAKPKVTAKPKTPSTPKVTGEVKTVYLQVRDRWENVTSQNLDLSKYTVKSYIEPVGTVYISQ